MDSTGIARILKILSHLWLLSVTTAYSQTFENPNITYTGPFGGDGRGFDNLVTYFDPVRDVSYAGQWPTWNLANFIDDRAAVNLLPPGTSAIARHGRYTPEQAKKMLDALFDVDPSARRIVALSCNDTSFPLPGASSPASTLANQLPPKYTTIGINDRFAGTTLRVTQTSETEVLIELIAPNGTSYSPPEEAISIFRTTPSGVSERPFGPGGVEAAEKLGFKFAAATDSIPDPSPQSIAGDVPFADRLRGGSGAADSALDAARGCGCGMRVLTGAGRVLKYLPLVGAGIDGVKVYYAETPEAKEAAFQDMQMNLTPAGSLMLIYPSAEQRRAGNMPWGGAWGGGPDVAIQRAPDRTWLGWALGYPLYSPLPPLPAGALE